jgi:microcystin-dependent protein
MPFPGMTNRTELEMYPAVLSEFEHIYAQLQGFLTQAGFSSAGGFSIESEDTTNPPGSIIALGGDDIPNGWSECDGGPLSREAERRLFGVIGVRWGAGDGVTTYNKPDLRRRFPVGASAADTVGGTGGTWDHTHTNPNTAAATLPELDVTGNTGTTAPDVDLTGNVINVETAIDPGTDVVVSDTYAVDAHAHDAGTLKVPTGEGSHVHTQGASGSANPPYAFVRWIIKL